MTEKTNIVLSVLLVTLLSVSPVEAEKKKRTLWGAGIGAVAGGLIGGNFSDMAIGAIAGGGLGYLTGDDKDKKRAEEQAEKEKQARAKAQITSDPKTAYQDPGDNPFVGSTWRMVSLVSDNTDLYPEYADLVVTFATNSKVSTMAVHKDGETESWVENYRIIDDVMVVSGTDPKTNELYVVNAKYSVEGDQFVFVAPEIRYVFKAVK